MLAWRRLSEQEDPHEAALALLGELYGAPLPEIRRTALGKPYFADSDLHFSISHTKSHVFCVLSNRPVGIDAEEADRQIKLSLAEKILSPSEFARFEQAQDKRLALLKFWVLKEADGKRTGEGLRIYPNHTDFSPDDARVQTIDGCLAAIIEEEDAYVI